MSHRLLPARRAMCAAALVGLAIPLLTAGAGDFTRVRWVAETAAPVRRTEAMGAVVQGRLWVLGGFRDDPFGAVRSVQVYDPRTDRWSRGPDLPEALTHGATAVDRTWLYLAGGYTSGTRARYAIATVRRLDTRTGRWISLPPLPEPRGSGGLVFLDRTLHFFAGNDETRRDRGSHWSLDVDERPWRWRERAHLGNPRSHLGYAAVDGRIYAVGGQRGHDEHLVPQDTVSMWDPARPDRWTSMAPLPQPLSHIGPATFAHAGRLVVLGGESGHLHAVRGTYAHRRGQGWVALHTLPRSRYSAVAGAIGGNLFITGGSAYGGPFQTSTWRGVPG